MAILTKQELIDNIASTWKQQYCFQGVWEYGHDKKEIYDKLVALGDDKTEKQITEIIGNPSWTDLKCDECDKKVDSVKIFGDGYESSVYVCLKCLKKSVKELKND